MKTWQRFFLGLFVWAGVVFGVQAIPADRAADDSVDPDDVADASSVASAGVSTPGEGELTGDDDATPTPRPPQWQDYWSGHTDIWGNEVWYRYDEHVREDGVTERYFVADAFRLVRPDQSGNDTDESIWMNVEEFKTRMGATR